MIRTARPRRSRAAGGLIAGLVVFAIALTWLWSTGRLGPLEGGDPAPPVSAVPSASVPGPPSDAFAITVEYVIDGDTVKARAQDATAVMPDAETVSVRLIGIDTPETYPDEECWGPEATRMLRELAPEGSTLWAAPDAEWHDRYGRVLLYLWTPDGVFVNHELVETGAAEALRVEPNDAHAGLFAEAQESARSAGAGQWTACF